MSTRDRSQKAARRLQKEFPDWSYSSLLRLCRELGEERARAKLAGLAVSVDRELAALGPAGKSV